MCEFAPICDYLCVYDCAYSSRNDLSLYSFVCPRANLCLSLSVCMSVPVRISFVQVVRADLRHTISKYEDGKASMYSKITNIHMNICVYEYIHTHAHVLILLLFLLPWLRGELHYLKGFEKLQLSSCELLSSP